MVQISTFKYFLCLSIFLLGIKFISAQTVNIKTFIEKKTINSQIIGFETVNDAVFNFKEFNTNKDKLKLGFNLMIEDELPDDNFIIKDLFSYSFGLNYQLRSFELAIVVENFFNLLNNEFLIEPSYIAINDQVNIIQLESNTAYLISASLKINLF